MKARILFATILAASLCTQAATAATGGVTANIPNPTTYTDGAPLPLSAITGYDVVCRFTAPGASSSIPCQGLTPATTNSGAATSLQVTFTYPATGGVACFQAAVKSTSGTSALSAVGPQSCYTLAAIVPNPPGPLTVTVTVSVAIN